ncbi:MAG: SAM-dependent methyltransferase [Elusimicrobiota bacterium]|nr:MAG: SAM-dependent methyltransferase [Elusimicrobiota bacterium]
MTEAERLRALEREMDAATAAAWLPRLKEAVDRVSHGGGGPSSRPDAEIDSALGKAISVLPSDWELLCLRGVVLAGRSDFAAAEKDFERAAALAPRSPKPLTDRAYLRTRLGDWAGALADLDRALPLANGAASLRFERALVLLSLGEAAKARAELEAAAAAGFKGPELEYQLGRAELAAGRPKEALARFVAARKESAGRPERAKLFEAFEAAAAGDQIMKEPKTKKTAAPKAGAGRLWLLGVGIERPYEITLNTIMALRRCGSAYTQNDTREVRELLEAVYPGLKTIPTASGRGADPQGATWKAVRADLDKGLQTAYVTYGHPMLFGEGNMMAKRCKEAGYEYRVVTAPPRSTGS